VAQVLSLARATNKPDPGNSILKRGKGWYKSAGNQNARTHAYFLSSNTSEHQFVQHAKNGRNPKEYSPNAK